MNARACVCTMYRCACRLKSRTLGFISVQGGCLRRVRPRRSTVNVKLNATELLKQFLRFERTEPTHTHAHHSHTRYTSYLYTCWHTLAQHLPASRGVRWAVCFPNIHARRHAICVNALAECIYGSIGEACRAFSYCVCALCGEHILIIGVVKVCMCVPYRHCTHTQLEVWGVTVYTKVM